MLTTIERLVERELIKQQWANFIVACTSSAFKEARNRFHYSFKASLWVHPLGYKGVNIGEITQV
jgi:hypothetical protein